MTGYKHLLSRAAAALCLFVASLQAGAQAVDSTDVFFKHLKLNEITVCGLTGSVRLKDLPMPVSVATKSDLQAMPWQNLIEALAHQPGISHLSTGSGISKPVIRGMGYNRVLTVVDGVRQEGQQWGDEHGIEIDGDAIDHVEIQKGPASLMYGSDAMAGVLILHDEPVLTKDSVTGGTTVEYQSNNGLRHASLFGKARSGDWVLNMRMGLKGAHAYKNKTDGYVPGTQFKEQTVKALTGIQKSWGHTHLTFSYYKLIAGLAEGERDPLTGELEWDGLSPKTYDHGMPYQNVGHLKTALNHLQRIGPGHLKGVLAFQQNMRKEYEDEGGSTNSDEPELSMRLNTLTYDLRYELDAIGAWQLACGLGGMYQHSSNLSEEWLIPAYRLFDIGAYATASFQTERLTVSGGLRSDHRDLHHRNTFNGLSFSLGGVWHADERLNLRLNIARGYRAPNISELASDGVHEGTLRYEVGNAALKSEHSLQADLGGELSMTYFSVEAAVFANIISNYIFSQRESSMAVSDEGLPKFMFVQGKARLVGGELSVDVHPIHSLHFGNSLSMMNGQLTDAAPGMRWLPLMPAPQWNSDLKVELLHDGKKINNAFVSIGMEHSFKQDHVHSAYNTETPTPAYTSWNASVGTDISLGRLLTVKVCLVGSNLTNKVYQSHLSRLRQVDLSNMGRNITLRCTLML